MTEEEKVKKIEEELASHTESIEEIIDGVSTPVIKLIQFKRRATKEQISEAQLVLKGIFAHLGLSFCDPELKLLIAISAFLRKQP